MTGASKILALSQPAVSQLVRHLEAELGTALFQRYGPRLTLSSAGQRLYGLAMPLVAGVDRLADAFGEQHRGLAGSALRIAVGPTTAESVLPGYLHRFQERFPATEVDVAIVSDGERVRRLRDFEADIAFSAADLPQLDLEFRPVFTSRMVLIAPRFHPLAAETSVSIAQAAEHPVVTPRLSNSVCHSSEQYGQLPNRIVEVDGWSEIKSYVEDGVGIAIVPEVCVAESDDVSTIPIADYASPLVYGMLLRRGAPPSLPAELFIDVVDELASAEH